MANYTQTRGWRNNNPLNIRKSSAKWQGMRAVQTDKAFVQFTTMAYGYRAAIKTLQSYYERFNGLGKFKGKVTKKRPLTIVEIIKDWAPLSDGNNPEGYAAKVERYTGISRYMTLREPKSQEAVWYFVRILAAMTRVECGVPTANIPWDDICHGYELAFPGLSAEPLHFAISGSSHPS